MYVLHKLHINLQCPISMQYSAPNLQKCTSLKILKFSQNTESLNDILKYFLAAVLEYSN